MTNVMRLRNTLQADYNEAVVSDFDTDLFLALDLALGMIEELQARTSSLENQVLLLSGMDNAISEAMAALAKQTVARLKALEDAAKTT